MKVRSYRKDGFVYYTMEVKLWLDVQIKAVEENRVVVLDQTKNEMRQVPFGTCIWTTGIRMHPLAEKLAQQLQAQEHW